MNSVEFREHFDVANPTNVNLTIRDVCNQLIHHSVTLAFGRGTQGFESVVVFSDYHKNVGMYELQVDELLNLFAQFAHESSHAHHLRMAWNEKRQDYEFFTDAEPQSPAPDT